MPFNLVFDKQFPKLAVSEKTGDSGCQIILGANLEDDFVGLGWGL